MHDPALAHPSYSVSFAYNLENWSAFPSDTAAYFFALAFGLAHLLRRLAIPIVLYTVGWVCLPRIYLGLHHASDIVVGISIGIAVAWVSLRSSRLYSLVENRVLTAMERKPEWFYAIAFIVCFEMATVFTEARLTGKALLHAVLVGLNRGSATGVSRPIEEWGGMLAATALLGTAAFLTSVFYRKFHAARAARKRSILSQDGTT